MNIKAKIHQFLKENQLSLALEAWLKCLFHADPMFKKITLLSANFHCISEQESLGRLTPDEAASKYAIIISNLLTLLGQWEPIGDFSVLHHEINSLEIDLDIEKGPINLLNCDRKLGFRKFVRLFAKNQIEQKKQFYFIAACRNEMPDSFTKRLVYHLIEEEFGDENSSISFPKKEGLDYLKIEKLLLGSDTISSKRKIKKYFLDRFQINENLGSSTFFESGMDKLPYKQIVSIFDISEKEWEGDEGEISDYLQWLMDTFHFSNPNGPKFIFFVIVYISNLYDPTKIRDEQKKILQEIEGLCNANETSLLTELTPVPTAEIVDWFSDISIKNPNISRQLVQSLVHGLPLVEQKMYTEKDLLHMKDVEVLQKSVYDHFFK